MTNDDLGDMIHDNNVIAIPVGFKIKCIKAIKFTDTNDIKVFCVGRMAEVIHFEQTYLHKGDKSPFLVKVQYQDQGGHMEHMLRYFSLDDLDTMMTADRFDILLKTMEFNFGFMIL